MLVISFRRDLEYGILHLFHRLYDSSKCPKFEVLFKHYEFD